MTDNDQNTIGDDPTRESDSSDHRAENAPDTIGDMLTYHGSPGMLLLERHRLLSELGRDGMGKVSLTRDLKLKDDQVAVKVRDFGAAHGIKDNHLRPFLKPLRAGIFFIPIVMLALAGCAWIQPSRPLSESEWNRFEEQSLLVHGLRQTDSLLIYSALYFPRDLIDIPFNILNQGKHFDDPDPGLMLAAGSLYTGLTVCVFDWGYYAVLGGLATVGVYYAYGYPYTVMPMETWLLRGPYDDSVFKKEKDYHFHFFPNLRRMLTLREAAAENRRNRQDPE